MTSQELINKIANFEGGKITIDIGALLDLAQYREPLNIKELAEEVKAILAETPPADPEGIIVSAGDNLQEAINDAGTTPIYPRNGTYVGGFKLKSGTTIRAYPGEKPVFTGAKVLRADSWEKSGETYYLPWSLPFYQHPAIQTRTLAHRNAMQPHLIICDGRPLRTAYTNAQMSNFHEGSPGNMMLDGTAANPKGFWVRFKDGKAPADLTILAAVHQTIFEGAGAIIEGTQLHGLTLRYCANTGHQGAIDFPINARSWNLSDIDVQWSGSEGLYITGSGHIIERVSSFNNGHLGIAPAKMTRSILQDITYGHNAWKNGIDPKWHAGGLKATESSHNIYRRIKSFRDNGSPFWEDISCINNKHYDFELLEGLAFGLFTEHHSSDNYYENILVKGTRKFEGIGSGLQIQGHVRNCYYKNITLEDNADGGVFYKREERRGKSGNNTFENLILINNGSGNRWKEEGYANGLPDTYLNMDQPHITR